MRVLLAFDKFKDAISAREACDCASEVIRSLHSDWQVESIPLSDGGDGFSELLTKASHGSYLHTKVSGPNLDPVNAGWGIVNVDDIPAVVRSRLMLPSGGRVAIIEMAQASGLFLLPAEERNAWHTNTYGTGLIIKEAVENGVNAIILGIGGSATNDLGIGALRALGLRFFDAEDKEILNYGSPDVWEKIVRFDTGSMMKLPPIFIAYDTNVTLLGETGAARVYSPNKGISPEDLPKIEKLLDEMSVKLCAAFNKNIAMREEPGSGAAGGFGLGLKLAYDKVYPVSGMSLVEDWLDLYHKVRNADVVVTGEGRFDESSLTGKVVGQLVKLAYRAACPVLVFAGEVSMPEAAKKKFELFTWAISPDDMPLSEALPNTRTLLKEKVHAIVIQFFSDEYMQQRFRLHQRIRWTKRLLRYMPRKATVHNFPGLKWCADYIRKFSFLWSFRVNDVSRALYAGWILTWVPLYGVQITVGTVLAFLVRGNLPILIGLQMISNPLTIVPMWTATYFVADMILQHTGLYDPSYAGAFKTLMHEIVLLAQGKETFIQFIDNIRAMGGFFKYALICFFFGGTVVGVVCAFISDMIYRTVAHRISQSSRFIRNPLRRIFRFEKKSKTNGGGE